MRHILYFHIRMMEVMFRGSYRMERSYHYYTQRGEEGKNLKINKKEKYPFENKFSFFGYCLPKSKQLYRG